MLILDALTRDYGHFRALDGLSLEIADGQLHGFVGPNGAGKTTTMRILATLLKPTSGHATIDGVDVVKSGFEARKLIGYMPDFFGVYDALKCWEYLDFYGRCYRLSARERRRMTEQLLDLVQLADKRDAYVDSLSRGMKQRLCLARSLIHDPKLLILDEPASGMDPRARADMKTILRSLRDMGKTVLISGDGITTDEFATIGGPGVEGTLMTFPPDPQKRPEAAAVLKKFEARKFKPEAYTLYSYAAVQIMAEGAKRANSTDPKKIAAALHGGQPVDTVIGKIGFDKKGDITRPDYTVYTWKKGADGKIGYVEN